MSRSLPVTALTPLEPGFFSRPAEDVAPDLIGARLVQRQPDGCLLWGVIVETEAYAQDDPACHGFRRRSPNNETLFGPPGRFYVYVSYGIHYCVNVVTGRPGWANGVLLRSIAMPGEPERVAAGPGLLARRFGINRSDDNCPATGEHTLWVAQRVPDLPSTAVVTTTRIGISHAQDQPWRWYLGSSRSVSRRKRGDRIPPRDEAWFPVESAET